MDHEITRTFVMRPDAAHSVIRACSIATLGSGRWKSAEATLIDKESFTIAYLFVLLLNSR